MDEADRQLALMEAKLASINIDARETSAIIRQVTRQAQRVVSAVVVVIRAFARHLPKGMQAIIQAGVILVQETLATLQAVSGAYASGGVTAPLSIAVSVAALAMAGLAMAAALNADREVMAAAEEMRYSVLGVNTIMANLTAVLRSGGGF